MAIQVDRYFDRLCGLLLPPRCVLCGGTGQRPSLDLCAACERSLPRRAPALDGDCFAPFRYAFPMDRLIHALKYQGQLAVGRVLGSLLGGAAVDRGLQFEVDAVLPVPLHPRRHAERTFNQSAEIGRRAARLAGRPFLEGAVSRVRDTRRQVELGLDERRANLADAFECSADLCGKRIAIVDDVMTTGSTARSMARVLRFAGVASIQCWCVARAARSDGVDSVMHQASRDT